MTPEEFAARIKQKYPYLSGVPNDRLVALMVYRYPQYRSSIDLEHAGPELKKLMFDMVKQQLTPPPSAQAKRQGQTDALQAAGTQLGRFLFHPDDLSKVSAENRFIPYATDEKGKTMDWPIQDFGFKDPTPAVPKQWWKK
jgi:hypothetical protein